MRMYQQRNLKIVGATSSGVNLLFPLHHNVDPNIQYIVFIIINKTLLTTCVSISLLKTYHGEKCLFGKSRKYHEVTLETLKPPSIIVKPVSISKNLIK